MYSLIENTSIADDYKNLSNMPKLLVGLLPCPDETELINILDSKRNKQQAEVTLKEMKRDAIIDSGVTLSSFYVRCNVFPQPFTKPKDTDVNERNVQEGDGSEDVRDPTFFINEFARFCVI